MRKPKLFSRRYVAAHRQKRPRRHRIHWFKRLRQHPLTLAGLVFAVLCLGSLTAFWILNGRSYNVPPSDRFIVIISHDGQKQVVPTKEPTVGALLSELHIPLMTGDVVEPSVSSSINQDQYRINIYRAQPVELIDGTHHVETVSAAVTPRSIASQAGITVYAEDNLNIVAPEKFLHDSSISKRIVIARALPVNVDVYGTPTAMRTQATTVGGLLKEKHITLTSNDSVQPAATTPITPNQQIYLVGKGFGIITVNQTTPAPVQTVYDDSLTFGTSAVRQQGSAGQQIITYKVNKQTGERTPLQVITVSQPVAEIIVAGTSLSGIKDDMGLAGIAPSDYQYADYIISHESGWCPTKAQGEHSCPAVPDNSGTSAGYGLCQATPGYKMSSAGDDWATSPITQLRWCSGYAHSRYGSWAAAYNHWVAYSNW